MAAMTLALPYGSGKSHTLISSLAKLHQKYLSWNWKIIRVVMMHNETRLRAITAVLRLEAFTIPDLCATSDLGRSQVYPLIAELKRRGALKVVPLPNEGEERRPHRPLNLYRLVTDPAKRRVLIDEVAPFLRVAERAGRNGPGPEYRGACEALDSIEPQFNAIEDRLQLFWSNKLVIDRLRQGLKEAREAMELATYEAGIDLERLEKDPASDDERLIFDGWRRLRAYFVRFSKLEEHITAITQERIAQEQFSQWLNPLTRLLSSRKSLSLPEVRISLSQQCQHTDNRSLKRLWRSTMDNLVENVRPEYTMTSRQKAESYQVCSVLASNAIRYSADPTPALRLTLRLLRQDRENPQLWYNLANLWLITGKERQAYRCWRKSVMDVGLPALHRVELNRRYCFVVLIAVTRGFLEDGLSRLEKEVVDRASLSIVTSQPVGMIGTEAYHVKPNLFDPLVADHAVLLSDSVRALSRDFFVYGPLGDKMQLPGTSTVRVANALVQIGIEVAQAWAVSQGLDDEKALLILHSVEPWDKASQATLERDLAITPQAQVLGKFEAAGVGLRS